MQKLILFDIDGTLVHGSKYNVRYWQERVVMSIRETFGVTPVKPDPKIYNGFVDRNLFWHLALDAGVTKERFDKLFHKVSKIFHKHTRKHVSQGYSGWVRIPDAVDLVENIRRTNRTSYGLITGNIQANGWYKLEVAGIKSLFNFGVFADSVEDRLELARHAKKNAEIHFSRQFNGKDIIVIGDTKHDIRAGKHIGAFTIAVLTGLTETRESLAREEPDLLVDSLMDDRVLALLGLK